MSEIFYHECHTPGMASMKVYIRETEEGYEARQAFALFGRFNMNMDFLESIDYSPFHKDFHDNYHSGFGKTGWVGTELLQ